MPLLPRPLNDATKDLIAGKIDKQPWIDRIHALHGDRPHHRPAADPGGRKTKSSVTRTPKGYVTNPESFLTSHQ